MKNYISFFVFVFVTINIFSQEVSDGYVKFYYPNGQVSSEGMMKDGKPDGYWKTYYVTGIIKSEGLRRNFQLDSTWAFYDQSGNRDQLIDYKYGKKNGFSIAYSFKNSTEGIPVIKELYVNDKKEGKAYYYYDNGNIKETIEYRNGKKEGAGVEYNEKGQIITLLQYNNNYLINREKINRFNAENEKTGSWIEFYPNGKIHKEMNYKEDLLDGLYKEFDKNGNLIIVLKYEKGKLVERSEVEAEQQLLDVKREFNDEGNLIFSGSYKNDVPVGIHRFYDNNGEVINAIIYDNLGRKISEGIVDLEGIRKGKWKDFYPEGELRAEGIYRSNRKTGKWTFYYLNGTTEQVGAYLRGMPDGLWKWYYENGNIKREENYFNGREDGEMIEYSNDGTIIARGSYINGEKEGEWVYTVADHKEIGSYQTGLRSGTWKFYFTNGNLKFEGDFTQGLSNGKHKYYYPDGELKEERYYEMGIREKNWKKYDKLGNLIMTITYRNDVEYRINGIKVRLPKGSRTIIK